jgi:DNA-binding NarL/FixJ family response regulator
VARSATLSVAFLLKRLAQASAAVTGRTAMSPNPYLTRRQEDVLVFLTVGKTNREIAAELNLSVNTVKSHLSSIYRKLGMSNRTEAGIVGLGIFPMLRASDLSRRHAVEREQPSSAASSAIGPR